ncbi:MAG: hypothetical protein FJY56_09780 [Betaproteobacteria bacterium]|nr:hypothetical protein [Betaproteobacteria bacterium]
MSTLAANLKKATQLANDWQPGAYASGKWKPLARNPKIRVFEIIGAKIFWATMQELKVQKLITRPEDKHKSQLERAEDYAKKIDPEMHTTGHSEIRGKNTRYFEIRLGAKTAFSSLSNLRLGFNPFALKGGQRLLEMANFYLGKLDYEGRQCLIFGVTKNLDYRLHVKHLRIR